jgi:hypothetical protein
VCFYVCTRRHRGENKICFLKLKYFLEQNRKIFCFQTVENFLVCLTLGKIARNYSASKRFSSISSDCKSSSVIKKKKRIIVFHCGRLSQVLNSTNTDLWRLMALTFSNFGTFCISEPGYQILSGMYILQQPILWRHK